MSDKILDDVKSRMNKAIEAFQKDLSRIRTGRASLALLDGINIDYYGQSTPLNQVASLSIPESRLIVIQPWDKNVIGDIEKAIQKADLGLNPSSDGQVVRLVLPPMTEETRKDVVKIVRKRAEECKVAARGVRRDGNEELKALEKSGDISEDNYHTFLTKVQKITDEQIKRVDEILKAKEDEIMEI
ncbi:ribosome recycling factor [Thermodesulfobacteriota bacterium]